MSYEDEMRKQMEQQAAQCPVTEDINAEFGIFGAIKKGVKKIGGMFKKKPLMTRGQVRAMNKAGQKAAGQSLGATIRHFEKYK